MLPVYKAVSFRNILEKGARTKPWLVFAKTETGLKPYVVKVFDTQLIEFRDSVTNEVLGNILAKEFDLPVAKAALIDFSGDFIDTIPDFNLIDILALKDDRLKFGTELLDGYIQFNREILTSAEAKKIIDIDTVFAFDNLIRNRDRGNSKNLLVNGYDAYLIDHELGFEAIPNAVSELMNWRWDTRFCQNHIFYPYLKHSFQKHKEEYFTVFEEYLRSLNVNILDSYFRQLVASGFSDKNHDSIREYLAQMKLNSSNFTLVLRSIIF